MRINFTRYILLFIIILTTSDFCSAQTSGLNWTELHAPFQNPVNGLSGQKGNYPYLRFVTDASNIVIRLAYPSAQNAIVNGTKNSCILYGLNDDGKWVEFEGTQLPGDTIIQSFQGLSLDNHNPGRSFEYRLFLPVGRIPSLIAIGSPTQNHTELMPAQPEKQIVIYKQDSEDDAVAGNSWPARLERVLDRPVVVLDGRADREIFLRDGTKPGTKAVFLELCSYKGYADILGRIIKEARQIQRAGIPVFIIPCKYASSAKQQATLKAITKRITNLSGIYLLTTPATDDWIAFNVKVHSVLQEPDGEISTTKAVVQHRDRNYNWRQRHADELALIKTKAPKNIIFANSIIHYWGGLPQSSIARGQDSWDTYLRPLAVQNMGFGWDRIENVLWRIYHDELDGIKADHILLMIGTNNLQVNTDDEIIQGLRQLIAAVKARQPESRVLISGIFPRSNMEERIALLNRSIKRLAGEETIRFIDPGTALLNDSGKIREELLGDGLHPNAEGYSILAPLIAKAFSEN